MIAEEILANEAGERIALVNGEWLPFVSNDETGATRVYRGGNWVPVDARAAMAAKTAPQPEQEDRNYLTDTGMGLFQGAGDAMTLWHGDEIAAGLAATADSAMSLVSDDYGDLDYRTAKNISDSQRAEISRNAPKAEFAGNIVGGFGPAGFFGKLFNVGTSVFKNIGVGAAEGGVAGLGEADNWDDAGMKTAAGTLFGGAFSAAPMLVYDVYRSIRNALPHWKKGSLSPVAGEVTDDVSSTLQDVVDSSGRSYKQISNKAGDMGSSASFTDTTGFSGAAKARGIGMKDPAAKRIIHDTLPANLKGGKDRVRQTLTQSTGQKPQYWESHKALRDARRANAELLYPEALKGAVVPSKRMMDLLDNPYMKKAWANAQELAEAEIPPRNLPKLYDYDKAGRAYFTGEQWPDMKAIQEMKWALDDFIGDASNFNSADKLRKTQIRQVREVRRQFLDKVYEDNPQFRQANQQYAGDTAMIDAMEKGREALRGNIDDRLESIKDMTRSQKDAYLQGMLSDIRTRLGASPADKTANFRFLESENTMEMFNKLLPKVKARKILSRLRAEADFKETVRIAVHGSQTADNIIHGIQADFPTAELATMMVDVKSAVLRHALDRLKKLPQMTSNEYQTVAKLMTKPNGTAKVLEILEKRNVDVATKEYLRQFFATAGDYGALEGAVIINKGLEQDRDSHRQDMLLKFDEIDRQFD